MGKDDPKQEYGVLSVFHTKIANASQKARHLGRIGMCRMRSSQSLFSNVSLSVGVIWESEGSDSGMMFVWSGEGTQVRQTNKLSGE